MGLYERCYVEGALAHKAKLIHQTSLITVVKSSPLLLKYGLILFPCIMHAIGWDIFLVFVPKRKNVLFVNGATDVVDEPNSHIVKVVELCRTCVTIAMAQIEGLL